MITNSDLESLVLRWRNASENLRKEYWDDEAKSIESCISDLENLLASDAGKDFNDDSANECENMCLLPPMLGRTRYFRPRKPADGLNK